MLNKVMLIGHLGADPEIRQTQSGGKVASFSLATSERWRDKASGERRERTEWHRIVVFGEALVDLVERYVKKGSKLYVEGQLATRKWQDQAGADRYTTEVVLKTFGAAITLLDKAERPPPDENAYGTTRPAGERRTAAAPPPASPPSYADELDDDIPF